MHLCLLFSFFFLFFLGGRSIFLVTVLKHFFMFCLMFAVNVQCRNGSIKAAVLTVSEITLTLPFFCTTLLPAVYKYIKYCYSAKVKVGDCYIDCTILRPSRTTTVGEPTSAQPAAFLRVPPPFPPTPPLSPISFLSVGF